MTLIDIQWFWIALISPTDIQWFWIALISPLIVGIEMG